MTLLRLEIECSRCGARPNLRITVALRRRHMDVPDDELTGTWQCQGCGELHILTARVFKGAA